VSGAPPQPLLGCLELAQVCLDERASEDVSFDSENLTESPSECQDGGAELLPIRFRGLLLLCLFEGLSEPYPEGYLKSEDSEQVRRAGFTAGVLEGCGVSFRLVERLGEALQQGGPLFRSVQLAGCVSRCALSFPDPVSDAPGRFVNFLHGSNTMSVGIFIWRVTLLSGQNAGMAVRVPLCEWLLGVVPELHENLKSSGSVPKLGARRLRVIWPTALSDAPYMRLALGWWQ